MRKLSIILGVMSFLIFIRPVLGLNTNTDIDETEVVLATDKATQEHHSEGVFEGALDGIQQFYSYTGFANATAGHIIMIIIGLIFIYLGIKFDYEPLLLIPIGTGVMLGNIPFVAGNMTGIYETGSVFNYLYFGVVKGIYPPLIFLGIGAMTDFSSLISNPKLMLLGAAAQIGVFGTFLGALYLGFNLPEAGAIGIIGGADGPTAIFLSSKLANGINILPDGTTVKNLIGPIAIAAYSYMALVPVIQPPIMRLLISKEDRKIRMKPPRAVSQKEKMLFPIIGLLLTTF
ncbi:MAG: sodium ion-translocating decarboxylase subunit beta, partial [Flavobacteriales bacterium]|nr:sodium ion-translocating decarboxylase subunit beta [Flavobacteriales bacterium]